MRQDRLERNFFLSKTEKNVCPFIDQGKIKVPVADGLLDSVKLYSENDHAWLAYNDDFGIHVKVWIKNYSLPLFPGEKREESNSRQASSLFFTDRDVACDLVYDEILYLIGIGAARLTHLYILQRNEQSIFGFQVGQTHARHQGLLAKTSLDFPTQNIDALGKTMLQNLPLFPASPEVITDESPVFTVVRAVFQDQAWLNPMGYLSDLCDTTIRITKRNIVEVNLDPECEISMRKEITSAVITSDLKTFV